MEFASSEVELLRSEQIFRGLRLGTGPNNRATPTKPHHRRSALCVSNSALRFEIGFEKEKPRH
jgi:hypothetical protein